MSVGKETWSKLSPLLDELLDLPDAERDARLAALRADDPSTAAAVAAMLGHLPAIERGEFMQASALPKPAGLAGQHVGPYTLEREIGHGGMGSVWLGRRTDGRYEGEVAIKFLRSGLFGQGDAERFEREGSILARLSHPHIARLLDAGVTPDGAQPYLVLEYVAGEPIDEYCVQRKLSVEARLRLMLDVLGAVAQAHNRLILHRDLKPSNILVTQAGDVKLLDFGIAKLLDDTGGGDQTALTARAGNAFTPEFAAPEQLQAGDVTTATDVYALGVLMYILLGGDHPTAAPTGAPLDRMRSVIETEPKPLSDAVLRRGGPTMRWTPESRKLAGELRGDIETIVAKALKKAPAERYANAADLADDIRRVLAHEPIAARPDSRLYRANRFVRRHRAGVAATTLAITALSVGIGVALWQAREAQAQRVQAEGLIEYMIGDLRKKLDPLGRLDILDGVGDKAIAYYAAQDLNRLDADSLARRARALHLIGDLADKRGRFTEAQRDFQQAADTTSELLRRKPNDGQRLFDQSQSEFYLGYLDFQHGHLSEAEAAFRRYLAMAERMNQITPGQHDWQMEKAYAEQDLAVVLIGEGRAREALEFATRSSNDSAELFRTHPDDAADYAGALGWTATALAALGRDQQAIDTENAKIAVANAITHRKPSREADFLIANGHVASSHSRHNLGQHDEALRLARLALDEHLALTKLDPSNKEWSDELVTCQLDLVDLLADQGDVKAAAAALSQTENAFATLKQRATFDRISLIDLFGRAVTLQARLALMSGESIGAALKHLDDYLADVRGFEKSGGEIASENQRQLGRAELTRGDLLQALGRIDEARTAWRSAASWLGPNAQRADPSLEAMTLLAQCDVRLNRTQEARALADKLLATTYRHPDFVDLLRRLGMTP